MRISSSSWTKTFAVLLLTISTVCSRKKGYDAAHFTSLLGDLSSLESEEKKSILKSLYDDADDINVGEESKQSFFLRENPPQTKNYDTHQKKKVEKTDKTHEIVQWHAKPSRIVEDHIEKLESNFDTYKVESEPNAHDTSSSYENQNYNSNGDPAHREPYHADPEHHNGHSNPEEIPSYTSFHHQDSGINHDEPADDMFYKKMKLKKVRRNCTRIKVKKARGWPDRSDTNIQGRSNGGLELPHYDSNSFHQSVPAFSEKGPDEINKPLKFPMDNSMLRFSGEHLHGIPRTHFFQYKNGEGVNHYHLHNHHHLYDANGKRINLEHGPTYRNLVENFSKLKTMLTTKDSGSAYPQINDHYRSTLSDHSTFGNSDSTPSANNNDQKKGYHYTGSHESYGRKTYKRIYPDKPAPVSSDDTDKSIGYGMFRYGAGQYGTDEFTSHEQKEPYPNEVTLGVEKTYPNSGEIYDPVRENKPYSSYQSNPSNEGHSSYNSDHSSESPYTSYNGNFGPSLDSGVKNNKYVQNYQDKSYESQDKAPFHPQEKAPYEPQSPPKSSYGPTNIHGPASGEFQGGYRGHTPNVPSSLEEFPIPYGQTDGKSTTKGPSSDVSPNLSNADDSAPPSPPQVTHSVSYSQDGDIDSLNLGPENLHLYQNLRPEPDPLTIPKNARIFEHYIRLHPTAYMFPGLGRMPTNLQSPYGNMGYPMPLPKYPVSVPKHNIPLPNYPVSLPKHNIPLPNYPVPAPKHAIPLTNYPVPLHKLIPNPLKMPLVPPAAAMYPRIPSANLNQLLQAQMLQAGPLYQRWW